jgi:hypothetical protein
MIPDLRFIVESSWGQRPGNIPRSGNDVAVLVKRGAANLRLWKNTDHASSFTTVPITIRQPDSVTPLTLSSGRTLIDAVCARAAGLLVLNDGGDGSEFFITEN